MRSNSWRELIYGLLTWNIYLTSSIKYLPPSLLAWRHFENYLTYLVDQLLSTPFLEQTRQTWTCPLKGCPWYEHNEVFLSQVVEYKNVLSSPNDHCLAVSPNAHNGVVQSHQIWKSYFNEFLRCLLTGSYKTK